ncbi:MAG: hypothetical protein ACE5OR_13625 [bacterium]
MRDGVVFIGVAQGKACAFKEQKKGRQSPLNGVRGQEQVLRRPCLMKADSGEVDFPF